MSIPPDGWCARSARKKRGCSRGRPAALKVLELTVAGNKAKDVVQEEKIVE